jgi:hypothetical protein
MTFTNPFYDRPKALMIKKPVETVNLIVHGQGVIIFDAAGPCCLRLCDISGTAGFVVNFTADKVLVNMYPDDEPLVDPNNTKGVIHVTGAYYWFSIDSQNQRLYAGIGEPRKETVIYEYQLNTSNKTLLENLVLVNGTGMQITTLLRDPITANVPLLVKDTNELSMESIASGEYMPKANLSHTSQKLYDCISGKNFVLNTPDFPDFTNAIEYSLATPGLWCHETIKKKATEFDKDKPNYKETYLRITLGENNGESPGIPYVMEIWPVAHFSPVHNHGGSTAIIRVLHGSINVSLFPFLGDDKVKPFAKADFSAGDITWISPTLNQVHQLTNLEANTDTCITIQCYMYESSDTAHYDYFDYLDGSDTKQQFEPDSDMEFIKFKAKMKEEWSNKLKVDVSTCCSIS